ncbi:peptidoglycan-binding domain-containing protein [Actinomadura rubrisoli]|uniref:Peptidoglycan-binding protein n=1 Tax=Actinomadura rubrisoli TaxID=2530368 RepID=A0A4R5BX80_9ACTN|nr:peptidoglycan-binding protein [Actinomadura rubrisoli]TDD90799.1 peptidoglycan-binding protein [Actinomadura rubrisoli]
MNVKRIAVAGLVAAGVVASGTVLASPASADTTSYLPGSGNWPVLRQGQTSENVRALQWFLSCEGYDQPAPSHFGPKTRANVHAFQQRYLTSQDGNVGAHTWRALLTTHTAPVGYGQRNNCVKGLQVLLNKWRYSDDLPISGYHGPRTKKKLIRFQSGHGLPATGTVDLRTYQKLTYTPAGK